MECRTVVVFFCLVVRSIVAEIVWPQDWEGEEPGRGRLTVQWSSFDEKRLQGSPRGGGIHILNNVILNVFI